MYIRDLELELYQNLSLCQQIAASTTFARELYAALCNNQFRHITVDSHDDHDYWSCSWRYAGEILSTIRRLQDHGGYMDWYCSGNEGVISDRVRDAIKAMGWTITPYPRDPAGTTR